MDIITITVGALSATFRCCHTGIEVVDASDGIDANTMDRMMDLVEEAWYA